MIKDLVNKANNEKYYRSIRYFSHTLPQNNKRKFIQALSDINIYLAAQCVMSSAKDIDLENELIIKAEILAKNFENFENSAKGFLALAEFGAFKIVNELLMKADQAHKGVLEKVFRKILENNDAVNFITFLDVLCDIKIISLIQYCTNSYNGQLLLTQDNKPILKKVFTLLMNKGNYGLLRIFIEKYDLYNDIKYILDKEPLEIVENLLNSSKKQLLALKLAYEIYSRFNLIKVFSPNVFLDNLTNNKKAIAVGLNISHRHGIQNNKNFNDKIARFFNIPKSIKQVKRATNTINFLVQRGLYEYLKSNEELQNKLDYYVKQTGALITGKADEYIYEELFISHKYSIYDDNTEIDVTLPVHQVVDDYFKMENKPKLDVLVNMLLFHYNSNLMEISHLLRNYELNGKIRAIFEYGCYVESFEVKTKDLLFLHKFQISENSVEDINSVLNLDEEVKFKIIGINVNNFRFNISLLLNNY